jgi:hypothetical protein
MRVICPNCQQTMTVADSEAGKMIACTQCAHSFQAPQMFMAPPAPDLPPVVVKPVAETVSAETKPSAAASTPAAPTSPSSPGTIHSHQHYLVLNRKICAWLAPICLSIVFLLTFFKWVGFYPAGYSAYSQNAWQALFADISVDPVFEKKVFHKEKELNESLHASWWLLPYFPLLMLGLLLAWADHILRLAKTPLPPALQGLWRHRSTWIAVCAGLTLFFLLIQWTTGFGLARALTASISEEELKDAKTPEEIQVAEMKIAMEKAKYYPGTTIWLHLAVLSHIVAVAGIAGETWLIHRGDKPPPRAGVMW